MNRRFTLRSMDHLPHAGWVYDFEQKEFFKVVQNIRYRLARAFWDADGRATHEYQDMSECPPEFEWGTSPLEIVGTNAVSYFPLEVLFELPPLHGCTCDIKALFSYGCSCGGFAREVLARETLARETSISNS